jgi:predicted nucleotidyltransferase
MTSTLAEGALGALPESAQGPLQELEEALEKAAGSNLAALVVYGSAVRGGFEPGRSDIDVIVVLHDTSLPNLKSISEPLMLARFRGRVEAMILKHDNIAAASDVFPLLYDDVRQRHVVLSGSDPFVDLKIENTHRRLGGRHRRIGDAQGQADPRPPARPPAPQGHGLRRPAGSGARGHGQGLRCRHGAAPARGLGARGSP